MQIILTLPLTACCRRWLVLCLCPVHSHCPHQATAGMMCCDHLSCHLHWKSVRTGRNLTAGVGCEIYPAADGRRITSSVTGSEHWVERSAVVGTWSFAVWTKQGSKTYEMNEYAATCITIIHQADQQRLISSSRLRAPRARAHIWVFVHETQSCEKAFGLCCCSALCSTLCPF